MGLMEVVVIIDGPNLKGSLETIKRKRLKGVKIDYKELFQKIKECGGKIIEFYIVKSESKENFFKYLKKVAKEVGVELKIMGPTDKPHKEEIFLDVDERIKKRISSLNKFCHHLVLASGDGDFAEGVKRLREEGVKITIISFPETLSKKLKKEGDEVIFLK